jgi:hypothetical protein
MSQWTPRKRKQSPRSRAKEAARKSRRAGRHPPFEVIDLTKAAERPPEPAGSSEDRSPGHEDTSREDTSREDTSRGDNRPKEPVAGVGIRFSEGPQGWILEDEYDNLPDSIRRKDWQMCRCPKSGKFWYKRIVGRYRELDDAELRPRRDQVAAYYESLPNREGPAVRVGDDGPQWYELEFIENVMEFELRPPCGCEPLIQLAAA